MSADCTNPPAAKRRKKNAPAIEIDVASPCRLPPAALRRQQKEEQAAREGAWAEEALKLQKQREAEDRQKEILRNAEVESQLSLHTHNSGVHSCPLAPTSALLFHGEPRSAAAHCSFGDSPFCDAQGIAFWRHISRAKGPTREEHRMAWTCELCDYDICQDCYDFETAWEDGKRQIHAAHAEAELKRAAEREAARIKQRLALEKRLGGPYAEAVKEPPAAYKDASCSNGYTIWSSRGYPHDGWHTYEGPPEREYGSTYPTAEEAIKRASYLFYFQNPWGLGGDEIADGDCSTYRKRSGEVMRLEHIAGDSETWIVAVVGAAAWVQRALGVPGSGQES